MKLLHDAQRPRFTVLHHSRCMAGPQCTYLPCGGWSPLQRCCHEHPCLATCTQSSWRSSLEWTPCECGGTVAASRRKAFLKPGKPLWGLIICSPQPLPRCVKPGPVSLDTFHALPLGAVWWEEQGRSKAHRAQGNSSSSACMGRRASPFTSAHSHALSLPTTPCRVTWALWADHLSIES